MTKDNLRLLADVGIFLENARYGDVDHDDAADLQDKVGDLYLQEKDLMVAKAKVKDDYSRSI